MNRKSLCFYILIIFIIISGCLIEPTPDPQKAVEVAARLETNPSWDDIRNYVFSQAISEGMSREEVHTVLDKVGPWKIIFADNPDHGWRDPETGHLLFSEQIRFLDRDTWLALGDWDFMYDENDKLVSFEYIDYA